MLKALNNRVVVKVIEPEEQKVSGIIIPQMTVADDIGEVVSVGKDAEVKFDIGGKVLLPHYGCNVLEDSGIKYYVLYASDILGVIR